MTTSASRGPSARIAASGLVLAAMSLAVLTLTRVLLEWPSTIWVAALIALVISAAGLALSVTGAFGGRDDDILVQALGTGGSVAGVIGLFLFTVVGLGRIPDDDEQGLVVLAMVAAGAGAAVFAPLRGYLLDRAEQAVQGAAKAEGMVEVFATRIRKDIPIDEVLLQTAEAMRRDLDLVHAEIWAGRDGRLELRSAVPDRAAAAFRVDEHAASTAVRAGVVGPAWLKVWMPQLLEGRGGSQLRVVPLGFGGELLGAIVADRADGRDFTPADEAELAELGRRMALALHNTQLDHALQDSLDEVRRQAKELEASRRRLVGAADEERRRIERNLHDGAQQHLVALSVSLNLAASMVDDNPAAAEMLKQLGDSVQETIAELRALAHGIYPPLLRDGGLDPALRAAAGRSPLDVTVEAATDRRFEPDVEAAVYFCCLEALQNASKHAPNASVQIRLWTEAGGLLFEVADDGPGFDPDTVATSQGFTNMADRIGAVGGRVAWTTRPGEGVTVHGTIPVGRDAG